MKIVTLMRKIRNRLLQDRSAYLLCRELGNDVARQDAAIPLVIRPMTADDLPGLAALRDDQCAARFGARLKNRRLGFVALHKNRIIHYSWLSLEDEYESWSGRWVRLGSREAYIYDGYTSSDTRGKRVYPAVLSYIQQYLRQQDSQRVWIMIGRNNHASLQSARRVGFSPKKLYINYLLITVPVRLMSYEVKL